MNRKLDVIKKQGWLLFLILGFLYAYPAIACYLGRSEAPIFFGRYSVYLGIFNLENLFLLALAILAMRQDSFFCKQIALILIAVNSLLVSGINLIHLLPWIDWTLPIIRLMSGSLMVYLTFKSFKEKYFGVNLFLLIGFILVTLSLCDLILLGFVSAKKGSLNKMVQGVEFRDHYDFSRITNDDIILVGDSFVWGAGVEKNKRYGDQLEQLLVRDGVHSKVYSLGVVGTGPEQYIRFLDQIPKKRKAKLVIISYYMNDMPENSHWTEKMNELLKSLRVSSQFAGVLSDFLAKKKVVNVEEVHQRIIRSYDKSEATFKSRWRLLRTELQQLKTLSSGLSNNQPIMVIIPLMVNFSKYPLSVADHEIVEMASEIGFQVIELLPAFNEKLGDGEKYRLPNDNHFNEDVHQLVATIIKNQLHAHKE